MESQQKEYLRVVFKVLEFFVFAKMPFQPAEELKTKRTLGRYHSKLRSGALLELQSLLRAKSVKFTLNDETTTINLPTLSSLAGAIIICYNDQSKVEDQVQCKIIFNSDRGFICFSPSHEHNIMSVESKQSMTTIFRQTLCFFALRHL